MEASQITKIINEADKELADTYKEIDKLALKNSYKVLHAFQKEKISTSSFNSSTGYGIADEGRTQIENIFAYIFQADKALVRTQIISGTHALYLTYGALLRPGDRFLIITGKPYDTMDEVIGYKDNPSSLLTFDIKSDIVDLNSDSSFDYETIDKMLKVNDYKMIVIQRSKGYSTRKSIDYDNLSKVTKFIKDRTKAYIMVDNCYTEFCEEKGPIEAGADIAVGSLIKNLGGFIANNGGYVVGRYDLVELVSNRLNFPGGSFDVGPTLGANKSFLQGLYLAPSVVASSLKSSVLASYIAEKLGYETFPRYDEKHCDIVLAINFNSKSKLIKFVEGVQKGSAIDSFVTPIPSDMPGYTDQIIMASGSFTEGSSIEFSCDAPIREPYTAYLQGSVTFEYAKLGLIEAFSNL